MDREQLDFPLLVESSEEEDELWYDPSRQEDEEQDRSDNEGGMDEVMESVATQTNEEATVVMEEEQATNDADETYPSGDSPLHDVFAEEARRLYDEEAKLFVEGGVRLLLDLDDDKEVDVNISEQRADEWTEHQNDETVAELAEEWAGDDAEDMELLFDDSSELSWKLDDTGTEAEVDHISEPVVETETVEVLIENENIEINEHTGDAPETETPGSEETTMAGPKKDGNLRIGFEEKVEQKARILVIGAGGAGSNAVDNMIASDLRGVEFVAVNTDAQALDASLANRKIQIGVGSTRGLGAGGSPERGREAAEENADEIEELFKGVDMVFIAAGMGGGTGTGSAPVIARKAREADVLTVGIVTRPFMFEGPHRNKAAEAGVQELKANVDTLIVIPNDKILAIIDEKTSFRDAFRKADQILYMGTKGISDIISKQGFINLDFADAKAVMTNAGEALMGIGTASGEGRAKVAAEEAITSPLLDSLSIEGAQSILVNVTGGDEMGLVEVQSAVDLITQRAGGNAEVFFGIVRDDTMDDEISVTVIATGFDKAEEKPKVKRMYGQGERVDEPSRRPQQTTLASGRGNGANGSNGANGHGPRNGNGTPKNGNGVPKNGNGVHEEDSQEFLSVDASDEDLTTDTRVPALDNAYSPKNPDIPTFLRQRGGNKRGFEL